MQYGRTKGGTSWHMLAREGRPICYDFDIVEVREGTDVPREDVCGNCDDRLREAGRNKAKSAPKLKVAKKTKWVNPKTSYRPRFKFEE